MLGTILVTLIGGLIIGLLGKMVAPGDRDNIPLWLTIICGIIGMIAGGALYWTLFGDNNPSFDGHAATLGNATNGVDWIKHAWQIGVAALAVMAAAFMTGRSKTSV